MARFPMEHDNETVGDNAASPSVQMDLFYGNSEQQSQEIMDAE